MTPDSAPTDPTRLDPETLFAHLRARLDAAAVVVLCDPEASRSFDSIALDLEFEGGWQIPTIDPKREVRGGGCLWRSRIVSHDAHRLAESLVFPSRDFRAAVAAALRPHVPVILEGRMQCQPVPAHVTIAARKLLAALAF